jgi:hypothetical protein
MNRRLKEIIKNHIAAVKDMYPEVYIEVRIIHDEIFICIDSLEISNEEKYIDLIYDFSEEYENHGFSHVIWGVCAPRTSDELMMFKNPIKVPKKENLKENKIKKVSLAKAHG